MSGDVWQLQQERPDDDYPDVSGGGVPWIEPEQSTTACCPRETVPDSCSCPDGCQCLCADCICEGWGDDGYLDHSPADEYLIYPPDRTTYGDSFAY